MAQLTPAQPHTIASASSSSCSASTSHTSYDVFINHRGPDVKKLFARLLYRDLKSNGLQVFLDEPEMESGHYINSQIEAAIKVASVHIAIFSPTYAKSKWCLDELVLMLDSQGTILPVFYEVKPSDVRWPDKGAYGDDLREHEKKNRHGLKRIEGWKDALSRVAAISGLELEAYSGDMVLLLDKVVERVLKLVPKPKVPRPVLYVPEHLTGLQEKLEELERAILSQPQEEGRLEAKVVGIVGLGGVGKSTLTRAFFNSKGSNYHGSSFLADVRENAAKMSLNYLQRKLIKDLTGKDDRIDSWGEGVNRLEEKLKSWYAFIILDDVDHRDQLKAFLPIKHVLNPNSLILVTSRNKKVLLTERIAESLIYQLKGLNRSHSLELFCWHAFFQRHPLPGFEDLANRFVEACDGLPLSLEVFGGLLCQENEKTYWEEQLNGLENLPLEIHVRLKISYDSLEAEEKDIFLDIACFSIGEDKDEWVSIWKESGWKGSVGLRNLQNKCLVEVDGENKIRMHDHLRDLGRNIAQEESKPRRLWSARINDIYDLLDQSLSSVITVRGIIMADSCPDTWEEGRFSDEVFRISKLQLLRANGDIVEGILSKVRSPNLNLIYLVCYDSRWSSLPSWIPMSDLRVLRLNSCKLERLWQRESEAPLRLRGLYIYIAALLEVPNSLGQLQHLEKIKLSHCYQLETLPDSFGNLTNLQLIDLSFCKMLKVLPSWENLTNLREIRLRECRSLEALPSSFEKLTNLQHIDLSFCKSLKKLPNFSENLTNLREIKLEGCESLEALPSSLEKLTNLLHINLSDCKSLKMLPNFLENLTGLREIELAGCESLEVLPSSLEKLSNLERIDLSNCRSLKLLPSFLENLTNLHEINLQRCESLEVLPSSLDKLSNLQHINLSNWRSLKLLPNSLENLTNLHQINLQGFESLEVLPNALGTLTNLRFINLAGCRNLKMLPNSIEIIRNLENIDLEGCVKLEVLPNAFGNLTNLRDINLAWCINLKMLPNSMENLTNLQKINLQCCESLEVLPNAFGNLTNLRDINLAGCINLKMLPNSIENIRNLEKINLEGCVKLEVLPNQLQVKHLHLSGCCNLVISNETLGNITTLECLDLSDCPQMEVLPLQVLHQRSLRRLNLLSNSIRELPSPPVVCLDNLEVLIVGSPLLKVLPTWLGYLQSLEKLLLHGCQKLRGLPNSVGQLAQLVELDIRKCGIEYLPPDVMEMNNLETLRVHRCPLRELPFKKVEGEGATSSTESSIGRGLKEIHLYLTEISEVSFPEGFCPNLEELKITWCNDLLEVGALPRTLINLVFRGCGALRKIEGLSGLAKLEEVDIRGCCALQVEELPDDEAVICLDVFETYYTNEVEDEMADFHRDCFNLCWRS